jgi:hypothetical protein
LLLGDAVARAVALEHQRAEVAHRVDGAVRRLRSEQAAKPLSPIVVPCTVPYVSATVSASPASTTIAARWTEVP